tara:strand:- start:375 stop:638 length:264 start_codon:yes stop_codon:yes gene_type:complete
MYKDDPRAEEYDKYGRYYPKETHIIQSSSIANFDTMSESFKEGDYNLFHRGNKKAQTEQLKHMGFGLDFFSKEVTNPTKSRLKRSSF